jgi:hypothetical protein
MHLPQDLAPKTGHDMCVTEDAVGPQTLDLRIVDKINMLRFRHPR